MIHSSQKAMFGASSQIEALVQLHHRTVDALHGYAKLCKDADPSLHAMADDFRALHLAHAHRMAAMLAIRGLESSPTQVAPTPQTAFDGPSIEDVRATEEQMLGALDATIKAGFDPITTADLLEMRHEVKDLLANTAGAGHPAGRKILS